MDNLPPFIDYTTHCGPLQTRANECYRSTWRVPISSTLVAEDYCDVHYLWKERIKIKNRAKRRPSKLVKLTDRENSLQQEFLLRGKNFVCVIVRAVNGCTTIPCLLRINPNIFCVYHNKNRLGKENKNLAFSKIIFKILYPVFLYLVFRCFSARIGQPNLPFRFFHLCF